MVCGNGSCAGRDVLERCSRPKGVRNVSLKQELEKRLKQYLSDKACSRKRNDGDNFLEGLGYNTVVFRFVVRTEEQLEQKKAQLHKAKEVLLRNIPGSDKIGLSVR